MFAGLQTHKNNNMNTLQQNAIQKEFDRVLMFCPTGICPFCNRDVLKGVIVNERTAVVTGCPNRDCHRSFVE